MIGRYEATGSEAEFEPGSRGRVLRNRLGITSVRAIQNKESEALLATTQQLVDDVTVERCFSAADIRAMHRRWLGEIYEWAGQYRNLNVAKGEFVFAAAAQVPRLMQQLEQGPLRLYTPCRMNSADEMSAALAIVHGELVLIHPFREGNGRCARLLATLMALQAGCPHSASSHGRGDRRLGLLLAPRLCGTAAGLYGVFEERANSLNGRRCGDGSGYRPFPEVAIAQVWVRGGKRCGHAAIVTRDLSLVAVTPVVCRGSVELRLGMPGMCHGEPGLWAWHSGKVRFTMRTVARL